MAQTIVPIVEGPGEVDAIPILLHKLFQELENFNFQVAIPKNAHGSSNLQKPGGIERFVRYAWLEPKCAAVLIIIDGDTGDSCAMVTARNLAARITALNGPHPVAIVVANREYEAWFLASLPSIVGQQISESLKFPRNAIFVDDPEAIRGVKAWLTRQLPRGKVYKETEHQAPMTRLINLTLARSRSRSFRRLCDAVKELIKATDSGSTDVTPVS